jgi:hypothetical protein
MRFSRRTWLSTLVPLAIAAGCSKPKRARVSGSGKSGAKLSPKGIPGAAESVRSGPGSLRNRPKGPQGFGNMMAKEWAKDLGDKSPEKRLRAATELANMGPAAASAVPALEQAAKDKNPQVSTAAKQALAAIRRK